MSIKIDVQPVIVDEAEVRVAYNTERLLLIEVYVFFREILSMIHGLLLRYRALGSSPGFRLHEDRGFPANPNRGTL